ncbi:MAG TPA: hypothetical protein VMI53_03720 [Opitutaceae bacterium]|nr:hypothetical protein [Opitutaceae bacterium]
MVTAEWIAPPKASAAAKLASKWILVISEQSVIRDLLERFFQIDGHFVSTAAGGGEGLDRARTLPVDLIVLDSDLCRSAAIRAQLKTEKATRNVPVLWIGARSPKSYIPPPPIADTDRLLTLPFTFLQVRETANHMLGWPGERGS